MEERELFQRYRQTGDKQLRDEIVTRYLYIASMIAKKFVGRGVEYDDLYQIASLALLKGIDRFDETKGIKFSTFITPTITGEIKNYFRDRSRLIHLPRRVTELKAAVKEKSDELFSQTGKHPSTRDLAQVLGVSEEEIVTAMEAGGVVSLDRPVEGEDGASFYDVIPAEDDAFDKIERKELIEQALGCLDETERKVVDLRYGQELSQIETAKLLNMTQMRVSRMERRILEKLREKLKAGL